MNAALLAENSLFVGNLVDIARANALADDFAAYATRANLGADPQCPRSPAAYNYLPFVELLLEQLPRVTALVGESLFPTFSYARAYVHGEVLERHIDRASGEISVTINLRSDELWPIYFTRPDHTVAEVALQPGEAAIYLGCRSWHWRNSFSGTSCVQVFLHYVRSRGQYARACFDNRTPHLNGVRL